MVKTLALVAIVVAALGSSARADRIKVAVVPSVVVNLDAGRVDALGQDLADALAAELDVDAIGGLEVRRKLPADGVRPDCATTPSCAAEVARTLGAAQLLFVVMVDSGGSVQVDSTWVEPASGHSAQRSAVDLTSTGDADAKAKFASAAHALLPDAPRRKRDGAGPTLVEREGVPRHLTLTTKISGGVAVAGLGVGIALGLETRSKYRACDADPLCAGDKARKESIRSFGIAADVGWLLAITGAAITGVLYASSSESPRLIVAPTANGVSLVTTGSF